MDGAIQAKTIEAMIEEVRRSPWYGRPAKTIFFGGGTPTFIEQDLLLRLFDAVLKAHPPEPNCEITSEANPGTVDAQRFTAMRHAGFNRISLGAQSFLDSDLIALGRVHRSSEIERAVEAARTAGFESLNLDLMFALPGQSRRAWQANLDRAISLQPEHLSLYCLTIEPNTAFFKKQLNGQLDLPDDDNQVAMYEDCSQRLIAVGFDQYEISNYARPGHECRHNLCYWYGEEYAGYGPGAVGCVDDVRYTNQKHPLKYSQLIEAGKTTATEQETIDADMHRTERIMLGLRLNEGISIEEFALPTPEVQKVTQRGWVETVEGRLRLTPAGRHFCSEVALELM